MGKDLYVCQIYVDDIIFGSTNKSFCDEFSKIMTDRFEMSMMEVLTFFLGFQIKQAKEGTFSSQMKYTHDILKKFGMDKAKSKSYKFAPNTYKGVLLGYDSNSCAYRVFNITTGCVETTCDAVFDETNGSQKEQVDLDLVDDEEVPCDAL
jgi:hypothetical protein